MLSNVAVALANLFRGAFAGLALEFLRVLAALGLHARVFFCVAVALADLLGRAILGFSLQLLRPLAAFALLIAAALFLAPFLALHTPCLGSSSLPVSSRHVARVSSFSR